jgi:hypothetical protein
MTALNKLSLFCLCFTLALGTPWGKAEDGDEGGRNAKIIEVNLPAGRVSLQVKNNSYPFLLSPHLIDTRTHQQIAWNQLVAGQFISFLSRPRPNGELEIVSLIIRHAEEQNVSAGGKPGGGPDEVSPFQ